MAGSPTAPTRPGWARTAAEHSLCRRAMGTDAHLIVVAAPDRGHDLLARACDRIDQLEQRWSRFLVDSEVSALNRWRELEVSDDTFGLIERALLAWQVTGGAFDPTLLGAVEASGYDRSFDRLDSAPPLGTGMVAGSAAAPNPTPNPSPNPAAFTPAAVEAGPGSGASSGCLGLFLDRTTNLVRLPDGIALDFGGIAKGYAADLVATELLAAGADGAMVNLGGDLRVVGRPPTDDGWLVEIAEATVAALPAVVELVDGGLATSSPCRRRWTTADGSTHHHLIDPRSGRPVEGGPALVSVIAGEAWWAEAMATALATSPGSSGATSPGRSSGATSPGPLAELLDGPALEQIGARVVAADGTVAHLGSFARHLVGEPSTPGGES